MTRQEVEQIKQRYLYSGDCLYASSYNVRGLCDRLLALIAERHAALAQVGLLRLALARRVMERVNQYLVAAVDQMRPSSTRESYMDAADLVANLGIQVAQPSTAITLADTAEIAKRMWDEVTGDLTAERDAALAQVAALRDVLLEVQEIDMFDKQHDLVDAAIADTAQAAEAHDERIRADERARVKHTLESINRIAARALSEPPGEDAGYLVEICTMAEEALDSDLGKSAKSEKR